ncbi:MAG: CBS domain-containing protein [Planctomycetota bacterium]
MVTVNDLMSAEIVVADADESVGTVRERMVSHAIHALPIVDAEGRAVGIVTATDLLSGPDDERPVSTICSEKVYVVPKYSDVHVAARVMRNQRIHHLVVTHEKKVVGVLSSFDLLRLVEEHRFTLKNPLGKKKLREYVRKNKRYVRNPETEFDPPK